MAKGDAPLQLIDKTLREMERDGTYAAIYQRWFGDAIRLSWRPGGRADRAGRGRQLGACHGRAGRTGGPGETYVVQPGDTLSKIARKYYGQKWATSWYFEANRDVIGDDPARLKVGMTLEIPK